MKFCTDLDFDKNFKIFEILKKIKLKFDFLLNLKKFKPLKFHLK